MERDHRVRRLGAMRLLIAMIVGLVLAGCGQDESAEPAVQSGVTIEETSDAESPSTTQDHLGEEPEENFDALAGTTWDIESFTLGGTTYQGDGGTVEFIAVIDGAIGWEWYTGCNFIEGDLSPSKNGFIRGNAVLTEQGCGEGAEATLNQRLWALYRVDWDAPVSIEQDGSVVRVVFSPADFLGVGSMRSMVVVAMLIAVGLAIAVCAEEPASGLNLEAG